jgi:hypothetical protein
MQQANNNCFKKFAKSVKNHSKLLFIDLAHATGNISVFWKKRLWRERMPNLVFD